MKNAFIKSFIMASACLFMFACSTSKTSNPASSIASPDDPSIPAEIQTGEVTNPEITQPTEQPDYGSGVVENPSNPIENSDSLTIPPSSSADTPIAPSSSSSELNIISSSSTSEPQVGPITPDAETFNSMFFGAWVGGPEEVPQPTEANVEAFERLQGRHLDVIHHFVLWQYNDWAWTKPYVEMAKKRGSIMMITWMPQPYTAQDILDGKTDAYLDDFAKGVKEFGSEIWLRPLHESNGDWYTWGTGKDPVNNAEDKVAAAYRHIVERFRAQNVSNVKWVWTTNASNSGAKSTLKGSYPGDDYVDYTSIDGYNWGTAQSWSSWQSFSQVFRAAYRAIEGFNKPMFIAEFSCSEHGGSKAEWFREMFRILPTEFPKIKGLVIFSQSKGHEADWGVDTSEEALKAWKEGIAAFPATK